MDKDRNEIVIHVIGGIASVVRKPRGVAVRIRDYDRSGYEGVRETLCPAQECVRKLASEEEISEMASQILSGINVGEGW